MVIPPTKDSYMFSRRAATRPAAVVLAVVLATSVLAACGSSADNSKAKSGPWEIQSGNGKTVSTPTTPTRIIAQSDAAASLLAYGIKPVGIFGNENPKDNKNLKGYDLSGIAVLGTEWGEINVEKAATLKPDLIVSDYWPAEKAYGGFEAGVNAKSKKLADLAPVAGGAQGDSIVTLLTFYQTLAKSLGANVDDSKDEKAFDAAVAEFTSATAANKGLTALAVSPAKDLLYVAVPKLAPELLDFQKWGLDVITPRDPDPKFPYWENLSWENADKYQPDLLLIDDRSYPSNLTEAEKQPTWDSIKAAKAGAIVPWPGFWIHSYKTYAEQLSKLATEIKSADPSIGS